MFPSGKEADFRAKAEYGLSVQSVTAERLARAYVRIPKARWLTAA